MKLNKKFLAISALAGGLLLSGNSQAGFIEEFTGYTVMGLPCTLCDSTVTFSVYENTGNWITDLGLGVDVQDLNGTSTGMERYVYMYQVTNTNPVMPDSPLNNFQVLFGEFGDISTSIGYLDNWSFTNRSDATADNEFNRPEPACPNDGRDCNIIGPDRASNVVSVLPGLVKDIDVINPVAATQNTPISIDQPLPGTVPDPVGGIGAFWQWSVGGEILTDQYSSVLFLTDPDSPTWGMGSSRSIAGSGASGTLPVSVPEPVTLALFGLGIAGLGLKRKKA